MLVRSLSNKEILQNVLVFGDFSGRLDHSFSNLNNQFKYSKEFNQLILIGMSSISKVLHPGLHRIALSDIEVKEGCGLIPLFGKTKIATKGLQWDLSFHQPLQMGGLFSSSNKVKGKTFEVNVHKESNPILLVTQLTKQV